MDAIVKRLKSKTYLAAIAMMVLSIIEVKAQAISMFLPAGTREYLVLAWPIVMFTAREITTTALSEK